jgi:hypothetical protein
LSGEDQKIAAFGSSYSYRHPSVGAAEGCDLGDFELLGGYIKNKINAIWR